MILVESLKRDCQAIHQTSISFQIIYLMYAREYYSFYIIDAHHNVLSQDINTPHKLN